MYIISICERDNQILRFATEDDTDAWIQPSEYPVLEEEKYFPGIRGAWVQTENHQVPQLY